MLDINAFQKSKYNTPIFDQPAAITEALTLALNEARRRGKLIWIKYEDAEGRVTSRAVYPFSPLYATRPSHQKFMAVCLLRWNEQVENGDVFDPKRTFFLERILAVCVGKEAPVQVIQYAQRFCPKDWLKFH